MYLTTRGLVLREVSYKESSKVLTVLTPDEGRLTVSARGARRKGSRISGASQLLAFSEMTLLENKGRWTLTEASTIEVFGGIRRDIEALSVGSYFAEVLEQLSEADAPDAELLVLGLNSLYALSERMYPMTQTKAVFELRAMCASGYAPSIDACAVCGNEPEIPSLELVHGTLRCDECKSENGSAPLDAASLAAMRHICGSETRRAFSFTLTSPSLIMLSATCEAYLLTQLERGFKTLDYYKKLAFTVPTTKTRNDGTDKRTI